MTPSLLYEYEYEYALRGMDTVLVRYLYHITHFTHFYDVDSTALDRTWTPVRHTRTNIPFRRRRTREKIDRYSSRRKYESKNFVRTATAARSGGVETGSARTDRRALISSAGGGGREPDVTRPAHGGRGASSRARGVAGPSSVHQVGIKYESTFVKNIA